MESARFGVRVSGDDIHADHHVRLRELSGSLEVLTIELERVVQVIRREVRSEGEWQPEFRSEPGAEIARTQ